MIGTRSPCACRTGRFGMTKGGEKALRLNSCKNYYYPLVFFEIIAISTVMKHILSQKLSFSPQIDPFYIILFFAWFITLTFVVLSVSRPARFLKPCRSELNMNIYVLRVLNWFLSCTKELRLKKRKKETTDILTKYSGDSCNNLTT